MSFFFPRILHRIGFFFGRSMLSRGERQQVAREGMISLLEVTGESERVSEESANTTNFRPHSYILTLMATMHHYLYRAC